MKRHGKSESVFNLTYRKISSLIDKAAPSVFGSIRHKVDRSAEVGSGLTLDDLSSNIQICIGGFFDKDCPKVYHNDVKMYYDDVMIMSVISMYHELRHFQLLKNKYKGESNNLISSYVAKLNNDDYYLNDGNRTKHLFEIDAEFYGVLNAYSYLKGLFPKIDSNSIEKRVVRYVNDRIQQKGRFENVPYQIKDKTVKVNSMEDIEAAFDASIQAVLDNDPKYKKWCNVSRSFDEAACLLKQEEWSDIRDRMFTASNTEKDKIVASVNVFLHDEFKKEFPDLKPYSFEETDGKYDIVDFRRKQAEMLEIGIQNDYDDSIKFE